MIVTKVEKINYIWYGVKPKSHKIKMGNQQPSLTIVEKVQRLTVVKCRFQVKSKEETSNYLDDNIVYTHMKVCGI